MDKVMRDLFGDEPTVAPAMTPQMPSTAPEVTGAVAQPGVAETDREARRAMRQERKADHEARRKRKEFVERYKTGDPSEGFSTAEALTYLREMRDEMSPAEFRKAMEQTLEHLSPGQREDFVKIMREYKASQPGSAASGGGAAPLGGVLDGLMGSGPATGGVGLDELIADLQKGGLRGASAPAGQPATEADFAALINSPLARAVLGGVAAFGMEDKQDGDESKPSPKTG